MATEQRTLVVNDGKWTDSYELTQPSGTTITFNTSTQYVDKPIAYTITAPTVTPTFTGGNFTTQEATCEFTNAVSSDTDTSGVKIRARGNVTSAAVKYNAAVNGWVKKSAGAYTGINGSSSSYIGTSYYLTGVTLTNGKSFDITVPNGASPAITFHFSVDNNGNTTVTSG